MQFFLDIHDQEMYSLVPNKPGGRKTYQGAGDWNKRGGGLFVCFNLNG